MERRRSATSKGDSVDRDVVVFLPPGYAAQKNRRYPVIYALRRGRPGITHALGDSFDRPPLLRLTQVVGHAGVELALGPIFETSATSCGDRGEPVPPNIPPRPPPIPGPGGPHGFAGRRPECPRWRVRGPYRYAPTRLQKCLTLNSHQRRASCPAITVAVYPGRLRPSVEFGFEMQQELLHSIAKSISPKWPAPITRPPDSISSLPPPWIISRPSRPAYPNVGSQSQHRHSSLPWVASR